MKKFLLICLLVLSAQAETYNLAGASAQKAITLKGDDSVNLSGSSNQIDLDGSGEGLSVMGSSNKVNVRARLESVDVMGSSNQITIDGAVETVNLMGSSNKIVLIKRKGRALPSVNRVGTNNTVTEQNSP